MTTNTAQQLLLNKIITFTDLVEENEIDFDPGMKGEVIGVVDNGDDVLRVLIDFSEYDEYNRRFAKPTYYDSNHEPTLYWWEVPALWPSNKRVTIYIMGDKVKYPWPFVIEEKPVVVPPTVAEKTVELFGAWLDGWSLNRHREMSDVFGAWDNVREKAREIVNGNI